MEAKQRAESQKAEERAKAKKSSEKEDPSDRDAGSEAVENQQPVASAIQSGDHDSDAGS